MRINFFKTFSVYKKQSVLFAVVFCAFVSFCCNNSKNEELNSQASSDPKISNLKLPTGFHADHLYSPGDHEQGSWVAMTFDDKGRMITCDQYGYLYRVTIPGMVQILPSQKCRSRNWMSRFQETRRR